MRKTIPIIRRELSEGGFLDKVIGKAEIKVDLSDKAKKFITGSIVGLSSAMLLSAIIRAKSNK